VAFGAGWVAVKGKVLSFRGA